MKLLSKIAKIATKVTATFLGLEDVIRGFVPDDKEGHLKPIKDTMLEVRDSIIAVELMAAGLATAPTGEEKLRMAGPLVRDVILRSALVANKDIDDKDLFGAGVEKISSGMADVLNSLKDNAINEENHG